MLNKRKTIYWVTYKYRRKKRFECERWKPKYRWMSDTVLVAANNRCEIKPAVISHVIGSNNDQYKYEVSIFEACELKNKGRR